MKTYMFGQTVQGRSIIAHRFGGQGPEVLVIGAVHGNEPEGFTLANMIFGEFSKGFDFKLSLTLVPAVNFDGRLSPNRLKSHAVDLNRNQPTRDGPSLD